MFVAFFDSIGIFAGALTIHFSSMPQFRISSCHKKEINFPSDLPAARDKIWRITNKKTPEGIRLQIECNNIKVVDIILSDKTCNNGSWKIVGRELVGIQFIGTASEYYRLSNTGKCNFSDMNFYHFTLSNLRKYQT